MALLSPQREAVLSGLAARAYLYRIWQLTVGNPPTQDTLRLLTAEETKEALSVYAEEDTPVLQGAAAALDDIAKRLDEPDFLSRSNQEYTVRFVGPDKLDAPPWESVYVTKAPLLFQKSTLEVRQFYRMYGALPRAYPHVADDHLSLELDFMALLSQKTHDVLAEGKTVEAMEVLADQQRFLREHLLKWLPEYAKKSGGVPNSGLYAVIANMINEFAAEDCKAIDEFLQALAE